MKKLIVACAAVALGASAFAMNYTWKGGASGLWNTQTNWEPNGTPGAGDVAVFTAEAEITDNITIGAGTLIITNNVADLHLKGVISGDGGLSVGGAGELYLYQENPFKGDFISEGTGIAADGVPLFNKTKAGYRTGVSAVSGGVTIYNVKALGTKCAYFDPNGDGSGSTTGGDVQLVDAHSGSRLTIANCSGTVAIPIALALDKPNNGTLFIDGGDVTFAETVSTRFRLRAYLKSANSVHFLKKVSHTNYANYFPTVDGAKIYLHGTEKGSVCCFNGTPAGARVEVHFLAPATADNVAYFVSSAGRVVFDCENAIAQKITNWEPKEGFYFDLNGYNQTVYSLNPAKYTQPKGCYAWGFDSPTPAQVRFSGSSIESFGFHGRFAGAAGIEWNPGNADREFTYTNNVSDTTGDVTVANGIFRLSEGASFSQLGTLSVAGGATFAVDTGAGAAFASKTNALAVGAKLVLGKGVELGAEVMTTNGVPVRPGVYTVANLPDYIEGAGQVVVRPKGTAVAWIGPAEGGSWNDSQNWAGNEVPGEGKDAYVTGAVSVIVDRTPDAAPHAIVLGGDGQASTLVFTNWNTILSADYVDICEKGLITVGAAFTNESDKARVQIECGELKVAAGGKIDVTSLGWEGGYWTYINSVRVKYRDAGLGPGGAPSAGWTGATHGGHGGYLNVANRPAETYDNPLAPVEPGSGGAMPQVWGYGVKHSGGGAIRIAATGRVRMDGEIRADGSSASQGEPNNYQHDTAASGGSVWITCANIEGTGLVTAYGGNGCLATYPSALLGSNGANPSCDQCTGPAGGGGMIAVTVTDEAAQAASDVTGLRLSSAPGRYPVAAVGCNSLPLYDKYNTDAEPGTLSVGDGALFRQLFGKGLEGRIIGVTGFTHEGDFEWSWGQASFPVDGFAFRVTGDLTITSGNARFDLGEVCWTNKRCAVKDVWAGRTPSRLVVGGDFTVADGATFSVRAAETNGTARWGAEVEIAGKMTIGDGAYVYAACDPVNLSVPHFTVDSLDVQAGGTLSANRRGAAGGWGSSGECSWLTPGKNHYTGFGAVGKDVYASGGSHGGLGGKSVSKSGAFHPNAKQGETYDNPYRPFCPGAGGNVYGYGEGGTGGGVIYVEALGDITVDGTVSADGWMSGYLSWSGSGDAAVSAVDNVGGGAGGTVHLCGNAISGSGHISARGADGGNYAYSAAGAGGGGRVALWTDNGIRTRLGNRVKFQKRTEVPPACTFSGTFDVNGGENAFAKNYDNLSGTGAPTEARPASYGAAGTIAYGTVTEKPGEVIFIR